MSNSHLLPELIINLVDKFKAARNQNEKFNLQLRLEAIRDYVTDALGEKSGSSFFKKRK